MRSSSRRKPSSVVGGVMPANVNSEMFEAPAADPSSIPPTENVMLSPGRYLNLPSASVLPERVAVRKFTPWIFECRTPDNSVGAGFPSPLPPPQPMSQPTATIAATWIFQCTFVPRPTWAHTLLVCFCLERAFADGTLADAVVATSQKP